MRALGRDPDHLKILPAAFVVVGETVEEARRKRAQLDSLVHYDSGIGSLNGMLGYDVSGFDPDGPLPEIPETNASKSARARMIEMARRREPDHPPARRSGPAATRASPSSARRRRSPTRWRNGSTPRPATAST